MTRISPKKVLMLLFTATQLACGAPQAGDSCQYGSLCQSSSVLLKCERNQYRAIACKGSGGCAVSGNSLVVCDWASSIVAGDACPYDQEGAGGCSAADPKQFLVCTGGTMVLKQTCTNKCTRIDDKVGCT